MKRKLTNSLTVKYEPDPLIVATNFSSYFSNIHYKTQSKIKPVLFWKLLQNGQVFEALKSRGQ